METTTTIIDKNVILDATSNIIDELNQIPIGSNDGAYDEMFLWD